MRSRLWVAVLALPLPSQGLLAHSLLPQSAHRNDPCPACDRSIWLENMSRPPLVCDLGSGSLKVGYAGNDAPRCVMPNIVGRPTRQPRLDLGEQEHYVGHSAITGGGGNHNITSPITRGLVNDWKDMEKVWHHVFYRELTVVPEETPVRASARTRTCAHRHICRREDARTDTTQSWAVSPDPALRPRC